VDCPHLDPSRDDLCDGGYDGNLDPYEDLEESMARTHELENDDDDEEIGDYG
jgi:hypothetical protein